MSRTFLFLLASCILLQSCWLRSDKKFTYEKQDTLLLEGVGENSIPTDMTLPNTHFILEIIEMNTELDYIFECEKQLKKAMDSSKNYTVFIGTNSFYAHSLETQKSSCSRIFILEGSYDKAALISKLANRKVEEINVLDTTSFYLTLIDNEVFLLTHKTQDSLKLKLYDQYAQNGVIHAFE